MNLVVWKNYLDGQILYRTLVPPIKNGVFAILSPIERGISTHIFGIGITGKITGICNKQMYKKLFSLKFLFF